jgi:hypothetical protein
MCLVCGEVVCSQSYCCQAELDGEAVGACTAHAHTCGARVGIFLRYLSWYYTVIRIRIQFAFLDPYWECGSGSRSLEIDHKLQIYQVLFLSKRPLYGTLEGT